MYFKLVCHETMCEKMYRSTDIEISAIQLASVSLTQALLGMRVYIMLRSLGLP